MPFKIVLLKINKIQIENKMKPIIPISSKIINGMTPFSILVDIGNPKIESRTMNEGSKSDVTLKPIPTIKFCLIFSSIGSIKGPLEYE